MTTRSTCPNCRWFSTELERLQTPGESLQAWLKGARKRIDALEA